MPIRTFAGRLLIAPVTLAAAINSGFAQEQTQPEQTPPDQQTMQRTGEEIVVTARKREENVQEVPIAVSVVTADELEEAATADISELQTQVPWYETLPLVAMVGVLGDVRTGMLVSWSEQPVDIYVTPWSSRQA